MTASSKAWFLGGLTDSAPAPVASNRHLRRFLYISLGIGLVMLLQARRSSPAPIASRAPLYFGLIAVELVLAWFVAIGIHARGLKLIDLIGRGWRTALDGFVDLLLACGTAAILRFCGPVLFRFLGGWSSQTGFLLPVSQVEKAVWILVSIAAGICEELVFRGYLQRQLWGLTRSLPVALLSQSVIFGFGHIYQGWKPAVITAIYGLLFGLVAAWRRSIIPGALAHAMVDVMGGLKL